MATTITIDKLLHQGEQRLQKKDILSPRLDSEVLLSYALNKSREFLYTYPREPVSQKEAKRFLKLIKRRIKKEPLAYIVGFKEFYGMRFQVNRKVMVPRPETEVLVREVLASTPKKEKFNVWDVGTGSGCIGITLAKILEEADNFKKVYAIDVDRSALQVAQENARTHNADDRIEFIQSDLLSSVLKDKKKYKEAFDDLNIIAANLPYLTKKDLKHSPTIQREPKKALIASEMGLKYYRKLLEQIKDVQASFMLIFEVKPEQTPLLKDIVHQTLPEAHLEVKPDLSGRDRVAKITIS